MIFGYVWGSGCAGGPNGSHVIAQEIEGRLWCACCDELLTPPQPTPISHPSGRKFLHDFEGEDCQMCNLIWHFKVRSALAR